MNQWPSRVSISRSIGGGSAAPRAHPRQIAIGGQRIEIGERTADVAGDDIEQ